jgi:hypothetical protein
VKKVMAKKRGKAKRLTPTDTPKLLAPSPAALPADSVCAASDGLADGGEGGSAGATVAATLTIASTGAGCDVAVDGAAAAAA